MSTRSDLSDAQLERAARKLRGQILIANKEEADAHLAIRVRFIERRRLAVAAALEEGLTKESAGAALMVGERRIRQLLAGS